MKLGAVAVVGTALVAGVGCTSIDSRHDFGRLREDLALRTGQEAVWPRSEEDAAEVAAAVDELLAAPPSDRAAAAIALLNDPDLHARLEDLGVARADLAAAARLPNPGLRLASSRRTGEGRRTRERGLALDLLDVLAVPLERRAAAAELELVRLELGHFLLERVAAARHAYFDRVAAGQRVATLRTSRDLAAASVELALRQRAAGNVEELAVLEREVLLGEVELELLAAEREQLAAGATLAGALGLVEDPARWLDGVHLPPLPESEGLGDDPAGPVPGGVAAVAGIDDRLDVAAARAAVRTAESARRLQRALRWTPVGLELEIERGRAPGGVRLSGWELRLELPVFDTGAADAAALASDLRRALLQEEAVRRRAQRELAAAVAGLGLARASVLVVRDRILPQRRRLYSGVEQRYRAMLAGIDELVLARQLELAAERSLVESWRDYWQARVRLDLVRGGAAPAGLELGAAGAPTTPVPNPAGGAS